MDKLIYLSFIFSLFLLTISYGQTNKNNLDMNRVENTDFEIKKELSYEDNELFFYKLDQSLFQTILLISNWSMEECYHYLFLIDDKIYYSEKYKLDIYDIRKFKIVKKVIEKRQFYLRNQIENNLKNISN